MPLYGDDVKLACADHHVSGRQAVQSIAGDGVHRFERPADLVGHIFVEDAGAFVEVFRHRDEGIHVAAWVDPGIRIGPNSSFVHQFLVGLVGRGWFES